jgi:hypothetical protein
VTHTSTTTPYKNGLVSACEAIAKILKESYQPAFNLMHTAITKRLTGTIANIQKNEILRPITDAAGSAAGNAFVVGMQYLREKQESTQTTKAETVLEPELVRKKEDFAKVKEKSGWDGKKDAKLPNVTPQKRLVDDAALPSIVEKEIETHYGKEALETTRTKVKERVAGLETISESDYCFVDGKLVMDLSRNVRAAGSMSGINYQPLTVAFEVITAAEAKALGRAALQIGKFFVRVNPYATAALLAYEAGSMVYRYRDEIYGAAGDAVKFAETMLAKAGQILSTPIHDRSTPLKGYEMPSYDHKLPGFRPEKMDTSLPGFIPQDYDSTLPGFDIYLGDNNVLYNDKQPYVFEDKAAPIEWDKQGKHVPGHRNHMQDRSTITISKEELSTLLKDKIGKGDPVAGEKGYAGYKERVDFGEIIGTYKNDDGTIVIPTTKGNIHYSIRGIHVVPARP